MRQLMAKLFVLVTLSGALVSVAWKPISILRQATLASCCGRCLSEERDISMGVKEVARLLQLVIGFEPGLLLCAQLRDACGQCWYALLDGRGREERCL